MTISTQTNKHTYSGDGSTKAFAFSFEILDESHIVVEIKDTNGTITTQTLTTHYTVSGTDNTTLLTDYQSGTVTFVTAPAATDTVVIRRGVPLTQPVDYLENDNFPAETHEDALDRLTMIDQQQQEAIDRSVKLDSATSTSVGTLPEPTADYYLKRNSTNDGFEWVQISSSAGLGNVVDDVSPQLGGDLDVNSNAIISASNGDIEITPNGTGSIVLDGLNWPQADGTSNQVLKTDGAGQLSWGSGSGGLADVVDDTTPQLGGDLDVNSNSIVSTSNGNIAITPNGTGSVVLDGLNWPQADGTNGQVIVTNGSGQLSFSTASGGLADVVDDTTPQLGGNLDLNSNNITGTGNINITGSIDSTAGSVIDGSADEIQLLIQGHSTQTSNILEIETSAASNLFTVNNSGNVTVAGTVDGRDLATDGTKLDGIEASADVTDATNVDVALGETNGLITRTADDTFTGRTLTGTSNEITVTNGDGVSGNPTVSLPSSIDLGGKTLEIPNGTSVTTSTAGQLAMDTNGDGTTVTQGVLQGYDGTRNMYYFGSDAYPTTDGHVLTYDSATNKVRWEAAGAGSSTWVPLSSATASSSATVEFTSNIDSTYNMYAIVYRQVVPATDGASLRMRLSLDGGATYLSSGFYSQCGIEGSATQLTTTTEYIPLTSTSIGVDNGTSSGGASGIVYIGDPSDASHYKAIWGAGTYIDSAVNANYTSSYSGRYKTATTAVDAVDFLYSSGNITSGEFILYGIKES